MRPSFHPSLSPVIIACCRCVVFTRQSSDDRAATKARRGGAARARWQPGMGQVVQVCSRHMSTCTSIRMSDACLFTCLYTQLCARLHRHEKQQVTNAAIDAHCNRLGIPSADLCQTTGTRSTRQRAASIPHVARPGWRTDMVDSRYAPRVHYFYFCHLIAHRGLLSFSLRSADTTRDGLTVCAPCAL